jgi:hypothetical protein
VSDQPAKPAVAAFPPTYPCLVIRRGSTPADLRYCLKVFFKIVHERQTAGYVFVHGWNDDPRGLVEIPEARDLCKEAIRQGILGCLQPSADKLLVTMSADGCPLGGVEIWAIANAACDAEGLIALHKELTPRFEADLRASAATLISLIAPDPLPATVEEIDLRSA